jgi:hypothetical protein
MGDTSQPRGGDPMRGFGYSASAAVGGLLTWACGRGTNSIGVVSNLTLRNG